MRAEAIVKEISKLLIDLRTVSTTEEKNNIMNQIDSYFESLHEKLKEDKELREVHKLDTAYRTNFINESLAIISEYYAPIFNENELVAINKLKDPYKSLGFNRSYTENKLLVRVWQDFINVKKYEAIELGYSNADQLPWGHSEINVFQIDSFGNVEEFNQSIDGITFISESDFHLPIPKQ
jgi:hypothetical protein